MTIGADPQKIDRYDVLGLIGRGGMGVVYKAIDPAIGRLVAIKMMTAAFGQDPELLKRFHREAQSAGKLQHPNILTIYELGKLGDTPFMVMEFIDGESLDQVISARRELPLEQKLNIIIQVCDGLQYAHERHIVHRDIKPGNVMIGKDDTVKIVDFGLAHIGTDNLTRLGQVMGSINYMSPEQINGHRVDARTDIFASGVVLYQFLTYALPFQGKDTGSTLLKIIHEPPLPLNTYMKEYPAELDAVIQRALAKDCDERYPSAEEFAIDLIHIRDELKREKLERCLQTVHELMAASELEKAQQQLAQLLSIDRQHARGNELMREVRQRIRKRIAQERAQELQIKAKEAFQQENLDDALASLEEAIKLDQSNPDLMRFRDSVQEAKARAKRIRDALRRAESAEVAGELEEALTAIEEVLALDPNRVEALRMQMSVRTSIAERDRRKQFTLLTERARRQIVARDFQSALDTLKDAEQIDAGAIPGVAPLLQELARSATAGMEQERRRLAIEGLASEIEEALHRDDYEIACAKADDGLRRFGDDRHLQHLKIVAEKQRQAGEKRAFVTQQIASSRRLLDSGKTTDALAVMERACLKYPGEPALQSMLVNIRETLAREEAEREKAECTQKAKDLLRRRQYDEAIQLLETARDRLKTADFDDVIQFAHEDAASYKKQQKVAALANEARELISAEEYEQAVEFLRSAMTEYRDEELQAVLADAQHHIEDFKRNVAEAVSTGQRLIAQQRAGEAVRLLESHSPSFGKDSAFRATLEQARQIVKRLSAVADAKEQARKAVEEEDFDRALNIVRNYRRDIGDLIDFNLLEEEIKVKRSETSTRRVESATVDARTLLIGRSYHSALEILESVSRYVDLVAPELKAHYESLRSHALNGIERRRNESSLRKAPVSAPTDYLPSGTLPQTHWPIAGAATPVLPPVEPPPPVPHGREIDIIGRGDSSSFHERLADIVSIVPPAGAEKTEETVLPGTEEAARPAPQNATAIPPEQIRVPQLGTEIAKPTEIAAGPLPTLPPQNVSETVLVNEPEVTQPDKGVKEEQKPNANELGSARTSPELKEPAAGKEWFVVPDVVTPAEPPAETPVAALPVPEPSLIPSRPPAGLLRDRRVIVLAAAAALIAVVVVVASSLRTTRPTTVLVPITALPDGATVRLDNQDLCVTPNCRMSVAAGTHDLQIEKTGYQSLRQRFTIKSTMQQPEPIHLTLQPLKQTLQISTNFPTGRVLLDKNSVGSLENGQFLMPDLPLGRHVLDVVGNDAEAVVTFESKAGEPATINKSPDAKQAQAIVVSSLGREGRLSCNCTDPVTLDGKMVGKIGPEGLNLKNIATGTHQLKVAEGSAQHMVTIATGPAPALDVFVASDRNVGTLVVETKQEGVDIFVNGKKYVRSANPGLVRIPLDVKSYQIQVQKKGYRAVQPLQAEIRRNEDTKLVFNLEPEPASLVIRGGPANAQVDVDGKPLGMVAPGGAFSGKLSPGEHLIEVSKSGYRARQIQRQFNPGQTVTLTRREVELAELAPIAEVRQPEPRPAERVVPAAPVNPAPPPIVPTANSEWERISGSKDPSVLDSFRKKYPDSPLAEQATRRIEQIEWEGVKDAKDPAQLQAFLRKYPNGIYSQSARSAIANVESNTEHRAIFDVLQRYSAAYERRDASELAAVWPSLGGSDLRKIRDSFKNARSVRMDLRPVGDPQVSGDKASVICLRSTQYTFNAAPIMQQDTVKVELRKTGGTWVIESVK